MIYIHMYKVSQYDYIVLDIVLDNFYKMVVTSSELVFVFIITKVFSVFGLPFDAECLQEESLMLFNLNNCLNCLQALQKI